MTDLMKVMELFDNSNIEYDIFWGETSTIENKAGIIHFDEFENLVNIILK